MRVKFLGNLYIGSKTKYNKIVEDFGSTTNNEPSNKLWAIFKDQKNNNQTSYLLQNRRKHHTIQLNDNQQIPPQGQTEVKPSDTVKFIDRIIPISDLIAKLNEKNRLSTSRQQDLKFQQGRINNCTFLCALNALYRLNPTKLSKLVSKQSNGDYQVALGNQTFTVKMETVIKQYNQPLRPVTSNNELIPVLENAYGQYLLKNYDADNSKIILTDKNNNSHEINFIKPASFTTLTQTKKYYQLLNNRSSAGYVFAFLNNIPFHKIEHFKFKVLPEHHINNLFNKKNSVTFISFLDGSSPFDHPPVATSPLDNYKLKTKHAYQVVPLNATKKADQDLLRDYNAKLVANSKQPLSNSHNLYRIINPKNTTSYTPNQKSSSKIISSRTLSSILTDRESITVWQVPIKEPPTIYDFFKKLFQKKQSKSPGANETKQPLDVQA